MLITARSPLGAKVKLLDVLTREVIPADACDTEEGWFDMYLLRPGKVETGSKLFVDRQKQELAKVRLHAEFDVVDRQTDEVLYAVRWTMTRPPRCYIAK